MRLARVPTRAQAHLSPARPPYRAGALSGYGPYVIIDYCSFPLRQFAPLSGSPKRLGGLLFFVILASLVTQAHAQGGGGAAAQPALPAVALAPAHGQSPSKGIDQCAESGLPNILDPAIGGPVWRMLRIYIINWLTSMRLLDELLVHGLQQNPQLSLTIIDGLGGGGRHPKPRNARCRSAFQGPDDRFLPFGARSMAKYFTRYRHVISFNVHTTPGRHLLPLDAQGNAGKPTSLAVCGLRPNQVWL